MHSQTIFPTIIFDPSKVRLRYVHRELFRSGGVVFLLMWHCIQALVEILGLLVLYV